MWRTVSVLEVIWLAVGLVPFIVGLVLNTELVRERRKLKHDGVNGADDIVIETWIGLIDILTIGAFCIIGTAVAAMMIEPATPAPYTRTQVAVTFGIFGLGMSLASAQVFIFVRRLKLKLFLRESYNVGHLSEAIKSCEGC